MRYLTRYWLDKAQAFEGACVQIIKLFAQSQECPQANTRTRVSHPCRTPSLIHCIIHCEPCHLDPSVFFNFGILQESNEANSSEETGSPDVLVGLDNSRLGETLASVVQEVLEAADGVVDEGEAQRELDAALDSEGQTSGEAGDACALEVKSDKRGGEVGEGETVHGRGEGAAGDSVPGGATEPCLLYLVDGQMGRDGTVEALVDEDLVAVLLRDLGRTNSAANVRRVKLN